MEFENGIKIENHNWPGGLLPATAGLRPTMGAWAARLLGDGPARPKAAGPGTADCRRQSGLAAVLLLPRWRATTVGNRRIGGAARAARRRHAWGGG
jgi:hypothetical protein